MVWVLMLLLSIIVVLLVRKSGTASIELPMDIANISNSTSPYSLMNRTENGYARRLMILESNQTTSNNYENEGVIMNIISDHDPNLDLSDLIMPSPPPNITCFRRDYDGDVAAIFKEKVGPISTAYLVFNTTYSNYYMGRIQNTTELIGSILLNETTIDCNEYPLSKTRRLNRFTKASLVG